MGFAGREVGVYLLVKLKTKILLILVPLILVPMTTLGFIAYDHLHDTSKSKALDQVASTMHLVKVYTDSRIQAVEADVMLFSKSALLHRYLSIADEAKRYDILQLPLLHLFSNYQEAHPEYYEIRVLLRDGYEDTRSVTRDVPNVTNDERGTEYFQNMVRSGNSVYSEYLNNPDNNELALVVGKKIEFNDRAYDPILAEPTLRGYLVITVDLEFLREQAVGARLGERGAVFFTDARGRIVAHREESKVGTYIDPSIMAQVLKPSAGSSAYLRDVGGEQVFVGGVSVRDNLVLMSVLPQADLIAAERKLAIIVAITTLGSIIVITLALFAALKSLLLKPIRKLEMASKEVGRGNLNIAIDLPRGDELGDLAKSFEEMSENLRRSGDEIKYLAYHDSLTGLPNRRMFRDYLVRTLERAKRDRQSLALLFLDLDNFKRVNDALGHQFGDKLLQELANRISRCVRRADIVAWAGDESDRVPETVARLGGDEFMILLPHLKDKIEVEIVARRILESISQRFTIEGMNLEVGASIGITIGPADGQNVDSLIKNADIAMYAAKEQGKGNYQFFSASMQSLVLERIALENDLKKAFGRNELFLEYQPQVHARSGRITGVEALVRWQHPELGLLLPSKFIPLAEETGLIARLGEWVLRAACIQARKWQSAGFEPIRMGVNISKLQLDRLELKLTVQQILAETGLDAQYLDLELTESCIMRVDEPAFDTLSELKKLGVQISMDDFGTGYSSLSSLKHLPISTLKIDQSFIKDICTETDGGGIISAVIAMARSMNLNVTAEGVEEYRQLVYLRNNGCDTVQGYLVSRPVGAEKIPALFEHEKISTAWADFTAEPIPQLVASDQNNEPRIYSFMEAKLSKTIPTKSTAESDRRVGSDLVG